MTNDNQTRYATYEEFWPFYLSQHSKPATRLIHVIGTGLALLALVKAVICLSLAWLIAAPVIGYGFAWIAHMTTERNRPATFTYPLWSLRGDLHMFVLFLTRCLENELQKHNISK